MTRRRVLTKAFGEVVREARAASGLSQERLAFGAGVHPTYISQLERGLKSPSLEVIGALAKALKTKPHLLIRSAEDHGA